MTRAVVTGATGFIGVHLVNELLRHDVKVTALCREGSPGASRLPRGVTVIGCGMDDYARLPEMWTGDKPDVFFHLAWEGATGAGRADEALQVKNAARTLAAVRAAKEMGCAKFVAAGTVYEKFQEQIEGAGEFRNAGFYILSKCYARDTGRQLALRLGIDFCWCTFCHPAGRYMKPEQLIAYAVKGLCEGKPPAFGAAREAFDIIAVEDLAAGLYLAGEKKLTATDYYIGSGEPRILRDYLKAAEEELGGGTKIIFGAKPDDGMRFNMDWFNAEPFMKATGFKPKISFTETLRRVRDYLT